MVTPETIAAVAMLGAAYCAGGLHGLWLAWTQETRMTWWADQAARAQEFILVNEGKVKHECVICGSGCRSLECGRSWRGASRRGSTGSASETVELTSVTGFSEGVAS